MMPVDVLDNGDQFVVSTWLPGIRPEDIQVTVQGNTLTIHGETRTDTGEPAGQATGQPSGKQQPNGHKGKGGTWLMRERRYGSYSRTITLPSPLNADRASTRFEHGELTITLPKAEGAKPKQIQVTGTAGPALTGRA
jgi:HSP20 family protein